MKERCKHRTVIIAVIALLSIASAIAQPAASPLNIQGLDQFSIAGVRSRAMGGTGVASANDASALFSNPAALARLTAIDIRAGGLFGSTFRKQSQDWVPFRPVPGLSVLFESMTGMIKTPDSLGVSGLPLGPWSKLQKQYDDIVPDWNNSSSEAQPLSLMASIPVQVAGFNLVAALGVSQTIQLDQYYQNNNSMTPYLGQQRPDPKLITARTDTLHVKWYQYIRSRDGSVYGVTPGFSIELLSGLSLGGSVTILNGSSDDLEKRQERGHINIAISNGVGTDFMVDTVRYYLTKKGTSSYSGYMFNLGLLFRQERYSIGLSVRPSMRITRTWDRHVTSIDTTVKSLPIRVDTVSYWNYDESGKDYLDYPLAYSIGIVLTPTEKWMIAFDCDLRNLTAAEYSTSLSSAVSQPWVNNRGAIRLGLEYRPTQMLALRAGYRDDIQAFSPDGSAIIGEPARGSVLSFGTGLAYENFIVNLAYEFSLLKFEDIYQSNANFNLREQHQLLMEIGYTL
jgi:long-subunit fatty acid transport protein